MAHDFLIIRIAKDKMKVELDIRKDDLPFPLSREVLLEFLQHHHVQFGINLELIEHVASTEDITLFPIIAAVGREPVKGEDGQVLFYKPYTHTINEKEKVSFRDIIHIPSVETGERIADIVPPGPGTPGKNIHGEKVQAKPGRAARMVAGENVKMNQADHAFYAKASGQLNIRGHALNVLPSYEVNGDLDMRTGNLDFVGSVTVRGNVPTGYHIKAEGDITVKGLVEGAKLDAGGTITITEGIAGQGKAEISAGMDIRLGYINQSRVEAGGNLFVEKSILHSEVTAKGDIYCQQGHIIGGVLSAGRAIEAKDAGNRMSTKTELYLGVNKKVKAREKTLHDEYKSLEDNMKKLRLIGNLLDNKKHKTGELTPKERVTKLRQKNSLHNYELRRQVLLEELSELKSDIGELKDTRLCVNGTLYSNVEIGFGKYHRKISRPITNIYATLTDGEIVIRSLG
ncbi:DUF342 domain-containing protein [Halobacillus sp. MO56]